MEKGLRQRSSGSLNVLLPYLKFFISGLIANFLSTVDKFGLDEQPFTFGAGQLALGVACLENLAGMDPFGPKSGSMRSHARKKGRFVYILIQNSTRAMREAAAEQMH